LPLRQALIRYLQGYNDSLKYREDKMKQRIIGFDLARAYAIFGMYIVNFIFCFGSFRGDSTLQAFIRLFIGNSTSIFIICAGMGIVLMTSKENLSIEDKQNFKKVILKRSWFLFGLGLLLFNWWQGDILHFYGGYMHIAAFILFILRRFYLWIAVAAFVIYNILQFFIPIDTGWNLQTSQYLDFWTPVGFLRNTLYNGWNSIFPWFAYFSLGMYLGKLDWQNKKIQLRVFLIGLCLLSIFKGLRIFVAYDWNNPIRHSFYEKYAMQILEDYFPASITFVFITIGWALIVIPFCMFLGDQFPKSKVIGALVKTGQMTLSHYVFHMTIGVLLLAILTHKHYTGFPQFDNPVETIYILIFAFLFFSFSVTFSHFWSMKFKNGPLETIMRKISDRQKPPH
jgi:uncharacterized protein